MTSRGGGRSSEPRVPAHACAGPGPGPAAAASGARARPAVLCGARRIEGHEDRRPVNTERAEEHCCQLCEGSETNASTLLSRIRLAIKSNQKNFGPATVNLVKSGAALPRSALTANLIITCSNEALRPAPWGQLSQASLVPHRTRKAPRRRSAAGTTLRPTARPPKRHGSCAGQRFFGRMDE